MTEAACAEIAPLSESWSVRLGNDKMPVFDPNNLIATPFGPAKKK